MPRGACGGPAGEGSEAGGTLFRPGMEVTGASLPSCVHSVGRQVLQRYGVLTHRHRPLPDFLLIGAKRSGTTSMYRYLLQHPRVLPLFPSARRLPMKENLKGVHYFDWGGARTVAWYRSHFPTSFTRARAERRWGGPAVAGEASPYYLFHPLAPFRAHHVVPDAKLVVLLRHPLDRTFSHYREQVRNGTERLSFEDALDAEASRLQGEVERTRRDPTYNSFAHQHQSYLLQSDYLSALEVWYGLYPRERLLVVRSEDFFVDPQGVYDQVLAFIGLPTFPLRDRRIWNATESASMRAETRARLDALFAPRIRALEEFLGRPLWSGSPGPPQSVQGAATQQSMGGRDHAGGAPSGRADG